MRTTGMHGQQSPPLSEDVALQEVHDVLLRTGWVARLECGRLFGDEDVRLRVGAGDGSSVVELLGRWGQEAFGDRWHAVRDASDGPAVWCGPLRSCSTDDLVRFVEDLLRCETHELAGRYDCQG